MREGVDVPAELAAAVGGVYAGDGDERQLDGGHSRARDAVQRETRAGEQQDLGRGEVEGAREERVVGAPPQLDEGLR